MNHAPIYISRYDYAKLRLLLSTALYSAANNGALRQLREELYRAAVIDPTPPPRIAMRIPDPSLTGASPRDAPRAPLSAVG